jgi:hypothetical protein
MMDAQARIKHTPAYLRSRNIYRSNIYRSVVVPFCHAMSILTTMAIESFSASGSWSHDWRSRVAEGVLKPVEEPWSVRAGKPR